MSDETETTAKLAFEAYGQSTGGKTWDGRNIPAWEELPTTIQEAWRASAAAVIGYVRCDAFPTPPG